MNSRRKFLRNLVVGSPVILGARALAEEGAAPAAAHVPKNDPVAMALGYKKDAATVDAAKYPQFKTGQICENCALYAGEAGKEDGPCIIFQNRLVAAKGWCATYLPNSSAAQTEQTKPSAAQTEQTKPSAAQTEQTSQEGNELQSDQLIKLIPFKGKIEGPAFFKSYCEKKPVKDEYETKAEFEKRCSSLEKPPNKVFYFTRFLSGRDNLTPYGISSVYGHKYDVETSIFEISDDYSSFYRGRGNIIDISDTGRWVSEMRPDMISHHIQLNNIPRIGIKEEKSGFSLFDNVFKIKIKMPRDFAKLVRSNDILLVYGVTFEDYMKSKHSKTYEIAKKHTIYGEREVSADYYRYEIGGELASLHLVTSPSMKQFWSWTKEQPKLDHDAEQAKPEEPTK